MSNIVVRNIHAVQYNKNDDINSISKVERCCDEISVKLDII